MKKLLVYLKDYKKESILGPLFKLLEASFELLVPLVVTKIIDVGIATGDVHYIVRMVLLMVGLALIGLICSITAQYFAAKAAVGFAAGLKSALFRHIQSLSYSEMDHLGTASLITRMTSDAIGGEKPVGLCGSGLIDLVAELLRAGLLEENGILHSGQERSDTFMLVPPQETVFAQCEQNMSEDAQSEKTECLQRNEKNGSGQSRFENDCGVYLTQKDIGEVQLAKAAIAAGIQLLLKKRSIEESQIQTVYLAGGFGNYMSAENAARIGLIPESFVKKVQCVGNIAGEGAKIALLNKNERHEIENAVRNMEFLELAACPEFQDCFVDELGFER